MVGQWLWQKLGICTDRACRQKLVLYLDGQLSSQDSQKVHAHLNQCRICHSELETLTFATRLAAQIVLPTAPSAGRPTWKKPSAASTLTSPVRQPVSRWPVLVPVSLALMLAVASGVLWRLTPKMTEPTWEVIRLAGVPHIGQTPLGKTGYLKTGQVLQTDAQSRALINFNRLGQVEVDPNSILRLVKTGSNEYRFSLIKGRIFATIQAPPRLFFIDTPAGTAVDLGCAYELDVQETGNSRLTVYAGWVEWVANGRTSAVPAGATCQARPGFGPGTPYFSSASEQLQQALVQFDFENGGSAALETVLTQASEHDSLTLFHLLKRVAAPDRERFFDRLATLVPLPQGVTREGILRLDPTMIQQWAHRLEEVSVAGNSKPPAVAPGSIYMTGPMEYARFAHTATLLPNGKVLVAGGLELEGNHQALDRAEVYDPATGTFTETGRMLSPRSGHSATLLPDGTVLIVGGATTQNSDDSTPTTEIYDSQTQTFRRAGSLHTARTGHTATLLENGNVLIAGGMGQNSTFPWLDSAEVYDPHTSTFTELNRMNRPRVDHSATLLTDGRVLVAGGFSGSGTDHPITASAEIFDPSRGTFHLTGKMNAERFKHSAVLLHDGSVFFAGGVDARQGRGVVATAERFDPVTEHFQVIGTLSVPRYKIHHSSVLLSSGKVLIAGGSWGVELFDPVTHSFGTVAGRMNVSRYYATATLLQNGSVLIVGGYSSIAHQAILGNASAWIFQEQPKSQKAK